MARIAGVDLPRGKRIEVALTYIYGIGDSRARQILEATGVNPDLRTHELGDDEVSRLRREIEGSYKVEGALRTGAGCRCGGSAHIRMPGRTRACAAPSQGRRRLRRSRGGIGPAVP